MSILNLTKYLFLNGNNLKKVNLIRFSSSIKSNSLSLFSEKQNSSPNKNSLIHQNQALSVNSFAKLNFNIYSNNKSILFRSYSSESANKSENTTPNQKDSTQQTQKKMSKFKQLYSQYGPTFLIVHLITVVLWIYGFFLISKQGYDITQVLNIFHSLNIMSEETVKSIHYKIDNYKTDSTWITGSNIKHFATAYMVYKVIAPFRYMVSIGIVRVLVRNLKARGLMKS